MTGLPTIKGDWLAEEHHLALIQSLPSAGILPHGESDYLRARAHLFARARLWLRDKFSPADGPLVRT